MGLGWVRSAVTRPPAIDVAAVAQLVIAEAEPAQLDSDPVTAPHSGTVQPATLWRVRLSRAGCNWGRSPVVPAAAWHNRIGRSGCSAVRRPQQHSADCNSVTLAIDTGEMRVATTGRLNQVIHTRGGSVSGRAAAASPMPSGTWAASRSYFTRPRATQSSAWVR